MRPVTRTRPPAGAESDAARFGRLFEQHAQAVFAYCARRTADLAAAEDLTSITFLEAWRHRGRVPSDGDARPWLLGVANNVVRNAGRARRRYDAALGRMPRPPAAPTAEDEAVARQTTETGLRAALDAIAALSRGEQEVVMVVLWSGLSYEDAATALQIPVGTVRSRLSRARSKLRSTLSSSLLPVLKESS